MDTYGQILRRTYARLKGQTVEREETPLSTDQVYDLLDTTDAVAATHLRTMKPAIPQQLTGDAITDGWDELAETYELQDPALVTWTIGDDTEYEIRVAYEQDGMYGGQWVFRDLDEDTVWATLNDV